MKQTIYRFFFLSLISLISAYGQAAYQCDSLHQHQDDLPEWIKPIIESSHSILTQDEEILNRDYSDILTDRRQDFMGYIGDDYYNQLPHCKERIQYKIFNFRLL